MTRRIVGSIDQDQAREVLLKHIPEGKTVYTVLRRFNKRSGVRIIDLVTIEHTELRSWGRATSALLQVPYDYDRDGIVTGGWGMDFGCDLVMRLAEALYNKPYVLTHRWI